MIGNKETIQNIAVKLTEEQIKSQTYLNGIKDRVIFVLGSKNAVSVQSVFLFYFFCL